MAGGKFWSEEDIEFLRKNYDSMTKDQLALVLGRTKVAIGIAATKIGVKKSTESFSKSISETRKRHKIEIESLRQQLDAFQYNREEAFRRHEATRQQLAERDKQVTLLRDGLKRADDLLTHSYDHVSPLIREALAATEPKP